MEILCAFIEAAKFSSVVTNFVGKLAHRLFLCCFVFPPENVTLLPTTYIYLYTAEEVSILFLESDSLRIGLIYRVIAYNLFCANDVLLHYLPLTCRVFPCRKVFLRCVFSCCSTYKNILEKTAYTCSVYTYHVRNIYGYREFPIWESSCLPIVLLPGTQLYLHMGNLSHSFHQWLTTVEKCHQQIKDVLYLLRCIYTLLYLSYYLTSSSSLCVTHVSPT